MKLVAKEADSYAFFAKDAETGQRFDLTPNADLALTVWQREKMLRQPDLMVQFVADMARRVEEQIGRDVTFMRTFDSRKGVVRCAPSSTRPTTCPRRAAAWPRDLHPALTQPLTQSARHGVPNAARRMTMSLVPVMPSASRSATQLPDVHP